MAVPNFLQFLSRWRRLQPRRRRIAGAASLVLLAAAMGQTAQQPRTSSLAATAENARERRTERALVAAEQAGPLALHAFLQQMPKGADLHNHLSGSVYAETWIAEAVSDHLCVNTATYALVRPKASTANPASPPECNAAEVPAAEADRNPQLYDEMIDAYSMRDFVPKEGESGHDHFFNAFEKFSSVSRSHQWEWLDQAARQAAEENTQYVEAMVTPPLDRGGKLGAQLGWNPNLEQFRQSLLAHGLRDGVARTRQSLEQTETQRRLAEHCGQPDALPACRVETRFLVQVLRGFPKENVFAQMVLCFEIAAAEPDVVGVNIVMPEDGRISMRDYHLQMRMFDLLHRDYPKVHLSLHAGELAPGLVPPEGLRFHIREAVELGHAERIGHGVDVMYEDHPYQLLRELAQKHVLVEINLTSNDWILGVRGAEHPFPIYRRYGVPVALSTDDAGVSRITLTHEYLRAAQTYRLTYADLKSMARASLEHSFLPGDSLWPQAEASAPERYTQMAPACAQDRPGSTTRSRGCDQFLSHSQKARQQWELEARFDAFEGRY